MIVIECMDSKEYSKIGTDLTIFYGFHDTIFGQCLIGVVDNAKNSICHLAFICDEIEKGKKILEEKWNLSKIEDNQKETKKAADTFKKFLEGKTTDDIHVLLKGTEFQITVWKTLMEIPAGNLVTYSEVAEMIKNPKANRAVAAALGANQVGYLIPCHRVVSKNGCNKFSWAAQVKEKMQNFDKDLAKKK